MNNPRACARSFDGPADHCEPIATTVVSVGHDALLERLRIPWLFCAVGILGFISTITGCGSPINSAATISAVAEGNTDTIGQAGNTDIRMEVVLAKPERRPMTADAEFTGSLLPNRGTPIMSEVEGVAMSFAEIGPLIEGTVGGKQYSVRAGIQPGQRVKEGQMLVQLDPTTFELDVVAAQARLDKAKADLAQLMAWERQESVDRLQATLDEAKARQKLAIAEHRRAMTLSQRNAASVGELERAAMELAAAEAMVARQNASLREAQAGPTAEAIAVSKSVIAQAEADLKLAEHRLEKTIIRAPYDGSLTTISVYKGQRVSPATGPMFEILDLRYLAAEIGVPEAHIGKININDIGQVWIVGSDTPVPGAVISINDKVDAESRSFRVRVAIDNEQGKYKAGQFVTVRLQVASTKATTIVPTAAIQFVEGQPGVFVFADGRVRRVGVKLGLADREQTEIASGISEDDFVVVDDPTLLSDGMKVAVKNKEVLITSSTSRGQP